MRVYIWCDGAAMPNGGPAGAGYVVVGGVHLLGSEALGDATNNVAVYMAVRNALRAALRPQGDGRPPRRRSGRRTEFGPTPRLASGLADNRGALSAIALFG